MADTTWHRYVDGEFWFSKSGKRYGTLVKLTTTWAWTWRGEHMGSGTFDECKRAVEEFDGDG